MLGARTDLGGEYARLRVERRPDVSFAYSGGAFVLLQHLLELLEQRPINDIAAPFLAALGMQASTLFFLFSSSASFSLLISICLCCSLLRVCRTTVPARWCRARRPAGSSSAACFRALPPAPSARPATCSAFSDT